MYITYLFYLINSKTGLVVTSTFNRYILTDDKKATDDKKPTNDNVGNQFELFPP